MTLAFDSPRRRLLAVSILTLGVVLERIVFVLSARKKRDRQALQDLLAAVERGDLERAVESLS